MKLARVIGTVVATCKDESLEGVRMMVIQPLNDDMSKDGNPIVATDASQSGPDELVYWMCGREAALALDESFAPVDASIVGIVDAVNT